MEPLTDPLTEKAKQLGRDYIKAKAWEVLGWLLDWVIPPDFSARWLVVCFLVAMFTTVIFYALMHSTKPFFVRFVQWLMGVILTSGLDFFIGLSTAAAFLVFSIVLLHYETWAMNNWAALVGSIGRNGTIPVVPR